MNRYSSPQRRLLSESGFQARQAVMIQRSDGRWTRGYVLKFDAETGLYEVSVGPPNAQGVPLIKTVAADQLKPAPTGKNQPPN